MTRVPSHTSPDGLDPEALAVFEHIKESRGNVIGSFAVLLASPPVAKLIADVGAYMRFESVLAPKVRELAITSALRECDAQFEWGPHEGFAAKAGVSAEAIDAIKHRKPIDGLAPDEAAIIRYARELLTDHKISDETYAAAAGMLDTREITELTGLLGYYAMVSAVLNAFEVPALANMPLLPPR